MNIVLIPSNKQNQLELKHVKYYAKIIVIRGNFANRWGLQNIRTKTGELGQTGLQLGLENRKIPLE